MLDLTRELWLYLRIRKRWWLAPILILLAFLGLLIVGTQGTVVAPFIYALF